MQIHTAKSRFAVPTKCETAAAAWQMRQERCRRKKLFTSCLHNCKTHPSKKSCNATDLYSMYLFCTNITILTFTISLIPIIPPPLLLLWWCIMLNRFVCCFSLNNLLFIYLPRNFVFRRGRYTERRNCNLNNFSLDANLWKLFEMRDNYSQLP